MLKDKTKSNNIPKGICKDCRIKWYGWALENPENRICDCGGEIIMEVEK